MSIRTKGKIIAGTSRNGVNLLDFKWSDHILDDISWLRADTFSWQSGDIYKSVWEHLSKEYNADTTLGGQTETIAGVTTYFRLAADGHKIVPANQEEKVRAIYEATGVAWYYILDEENKRFKLPRTKFGFTGLRDGVGKYVEAGLPNIEGRFAADIPNNHSKTASGAFSGVGYTISGITQNVGTSAGQVLYGYDFKASRSSSVYGNSDTVQPRATQMYLYFYVGNFTKTATENTAGLNTELFNNKADLDLLNITGGAKEFVAHQAMPSDKYINLTLGANGATYTAPADGYVVLIKRGNYQQYMTIDSGYDKVYSTCSYNGQGICLRISVKKGRNYKIWYDLSGVTDVFRFIYANGSK